MNHFFWLIKNASIILLFGFCNAALAQTPDIRQEIYELKQGQQSIREELEAIKVLLEKISTQQAKPTPSGPVIRDVEFSIGNNPVKGKAGAGLILIEFTDYECPFCGRYVRETFPQILTEYIDKGLIKYSVIDMPLTMMHPKAAKAAEASHCADAQGKFWEIHELMMSKQESLGDLSSYAESLNLDIPQFEQCLNSGQHDKTVQSGMALARTLGINAVPGFIIGRVDSADRGNVTGISIIQGAMPFASFKIELDAAIVAQ